MRRVATHPCVVPGPLLPEPQISFPCMAIGARSHVASHFRVLTRMEREHFILAGWRSARATCCSGLPWTKLLPGSPPHWGTPFPLLAGSSSWPWGEEPPSWCYPSRKPFAAFCQSVLRQFSKVKWLGAQSGVSNWCRQKAGSRARRSGKSQLTAAGLGPLWSWNLGSRALALCCHDAGCGAGSCPTPSKSADPNLGETAGTS